MGTAICPAGKILARHDLATWFVVLVSCFLGWSLTPGLALRRYLYLHFKNKKYYNKSSFIIMPEVL